MIKDWPVLKSYDRDHLARIALPLGGIGTGTVSLGGRGDLRDWELCNRPAKGFAPDRHLFAVYAKPENGEAVARSLEGPLDAALYEGGSGSWTRNHGLPRFRECSFQAAYPLGQVHLSDPDVPVTVRLQAFNPFIPGDAENSGLPVAVLRYVLTNTLDVPVAAAVCGVLGNYIGLDGTENDITSTTGNFNTYRESEGLKGVLLASNSADPASPAWGTIALTVLEGEDVSYRTKWPLFSWGNTLLNFWDDWSDDGRLEECTTEETEATASLAAGVHLAPHETKAITFILAWNFPNRMSWTYFPGDPAPSREEAAPIGLMDGPIEATEDTNSPSAIFKRNRIGNYYSTLYADAWAAAEHAAARLPELEDKTIEFVSAFCSSDLPEVVKESALFNLSTLRTQTCFRTPDGRFFGWEGSHDRAGSCMGSCTHVWNYEQATAFLFGDLARKMREVEFAHATRDNGLMSFRVSLPISRAQEWHLAAADGQLGCQMKLYRDWQLSGDDDMLRELWPHARRSLEFCWIPGGWDADRDGVIEGCQHNTMDVEYYGPNPQMGAWYLGALRASEEMAKYLGEDDFAAICRDLFERGSRWTDENLWNGEYYEHEIRPPHSADDVAPGLRHDSMGSRDLSDPDLQLGSGCLVDQLVGQYMAHVCGLGYLLNEEHVRKTLNSLMRYNFQEKLWGHFNHLRTFALDNESAMLMATYPLGRRPERPFPYYNEVMTGFEYSAAVHMLYEGQIEDGLKMISAIRARYDGRKRSPFDEAECGHHYARAMASWAAVTALTGFHYSGVSQTMRFKAVTEDTNWFWSSGDAWGVCRQKPGAAGTELELDVLHGNLKLKKMELGEGRFVVLPEARTLAAGEKLSVVVLNQPPMA